MSRVQGVECPECGSVDTVTRDTGHDPGGIRIRMRACTTCGERFTTAEVAVPVRYSDMATGRHDRRAARGETTFPPLYSPARLHVTTKGSSVRILVQPRQRTNKCRRGLHELVGANVYVNPTTGQRNCNPCRRDKSNRYYHATVEHLRRLPELYEEYKAKQYAMKRRRQERQRRAA